ncbi:hypothetical protein ACTHOQ_00600 [Solibacillus silvestris]|uniref:hypothetical protein n=1 Tax=Solibacillus silvestris TaxID=76853 RepID=UPI003F814EEE
MNKLISYVPTLCFFLVILFIESTLLKWLLLAGISCLIILAKYKRSKIQNGEFEFDDRVNANISKWSLRSMMLLNALLILILIIDNQGVFKMDFNIEMILVYLLITLCIPFYIVPAIIKHY